MYIHTYTQAKSVCSARDRRSVRTGFTFAMSESDEEQASEARGDEEDFELCATSSWTGGVVRDARSLVQQFRIGCGKRWLPKVVSCIGSSSQLAVACQGGLMVASIAKS